MTSSPKAPNPYAQASADQQAQTGAAIGSSIINNPNEISPYGAVNYSIAGWEQVPNAQGQMVYTPRYTRTTSLSPDEQKIANLDTGTRYNLGSTALGVSSKLPSYFASGVDTSQWTPWQTGHAFNEATDRPAIEEAMLGRWRDSTAKSSAAQDAQMAARGLSPGSAQYTDVMDSRARAATDAQQQAYLASGQEARSNYQTAQSYWDMINQLRQAQSQESFALRNQPLNEIAALMSGSQVNMPQFSPFSRQGIAATSPGSYMATNYQNQLQQSSANNQGLFGLGGNVASMIGGGLGSGGAITSWLASDPRLKTAVVPTGQRLAGVPVYSFTFRNHPALPPELRCTQTVGVMSSDVKELHPDAVRTGANGYDEVDYATLLRRH
jgi:hypothetical protein